MPSDPLRYSMHATGHAGVALLAYAPLGFALLVLGTPELAFLGGLAMVALASLPDFDLQVPFISHRGCTHTFGFVLLVGAAGWVTGTFLDQHLAIASPGSLATLGFVVGSLAILSHLAADAITPMGIAPFWPLSSRRYTLSLVKAKNPVANFALFGVGVFATALTTFVAIQFGFVS